MTDKPLTSDVLSDLLDDLENGPIPEYRTPTCPSVVRFVLSGNNWNAEESAHIHSCPRCQSRLRAAQTVFRNNKPDLSQTQLNDSKLFYFPAIAGSDDEKHSLEAEREEVFNGVQFWVTTRKDLQGMWVYGAICRQEIVGAKVVIRTRDERGEIIATKELRLTPFGQGTWSGEAQFDLVELEKGTAEERYHVSIKW